MYASSRRRPVVRRPVLPVPSRRLSSSSHLSSSHRFVSSCRPLSCHVQLFSLSVVLSVTFHFPSSHFVFVLGELKRNKTICVTPDAGRTPPRNMTHVHAKTKHGSLASNVNSFPKISDDKKRFNNVLNPYQTRFEHSFRKCLKQFQTIFSYGSLLG